MSSIGIMNPAFAVGAKTLLKWLNETFQVNYQKVEQCASGAIHCQILDAIWPGKVPLHKVNFDAKLEHEFVNNYKVLQEVFNAQAITKYVDVNKLIKAKYQDNLEFLQWIKNLYDTSGGGTHEYDALERRESAIKAYRAKHKVTGGSVSFHTPASSASSNVERKSNAAAAPVVKKTTAAAPSAVTRKPAAPAAAPKQAASSLSSSALQQKQEEYEAKIAELQLTIEAVQKERDFYYHKLVAVENLCNEKPVTEEPSMAKQAILDILYQNDEAEEFAAPAEEAQQEVVEQAEEAQHEEGLAEEQVEY